MHKSVPTDRPAHVKVAFVAGEPVVAGEVARGALAAAVGVGAGAAVRRHAHELGSEARRPRLEVLVADRAAVIVGCNKAVKVVRKNGFSDIAPAAHENILTNITKLQSRNLLKGHSVICITLPSYPLLGLSYLSLS